MDLFRQLCSLFDLLTSKTTHHFTINQFANNTEEHHALLVNYFHKGYPFLSCVREHLWAFIQKGFRLLKLKGIFLSKIVPYAIYPTWLTSHLDRVSEEVNYLHHLELWQYPHTNLISYQELQHDR